MKRKKLSRGKSKKNFKRGNKIKAVNVRLNVGRGGGRM